MPTLTPVSPNPIQEPPPNDPTSLLPKKLARARPLFDREIVGRASQASFSKLNPITPFDRAWQKENLFLNIRTEGK